MNTTTYEWDKLAGLELRRALAEVQGWQYLQETTWAALAGRSPDHFDLLSVPRWESDPGDALRLLGSVLEREEWYCERIAYVDRRYTLVLLPGVCGECVVGFGATLPEAIARACGKALSERRG